MRTWIAGSGSAGPGEKRTGRLLSAEIVGREDAAKRIDVLAATIRNGMGVDEMLGLDLSYAPPLSTVRESVLISVREAFAAVKADGGTG